jgi:curved DNA-binding protein
VSHDATQDEIKRAYRKLSRKYHPDVSKEPDADERFKELGEANEVLKDPEKRAAYDQLGANWKTGQPFDPPRDWDAGFEFSGGGSTRGDAGGYSDFFEALFGGGFARARGPRGRQPFRMRGEDHHARILIDLEDSFAGATRAMVLHRPEVTEDGRVRTRDRTLNVRIPKGIRSGQQIRLAGQGSPGHHGAEAGDLYLQVEFKDHPLYRVVGADLYLDLPVAPWEAALGATVKTPTPLGMVDLNIPANASPGGKLRLQGRGLPGKKPGDMYVTPKVTWPPADTPEAKALYRQMAEKLGFNARAKMEGS